MAWSHRKNARHRNSKKDAVRKVVCNKTKRKNKNEMAGWRVHGPEKDGDKRMERQSKGSRGQEAYCKGGQGPPRAVAPLKKKKNPSYLCHFNITYTHFGHNHRPGHRQLDDFVYTYKFIYLQNGTSCPRKLQSCINWFELPWSIPVTKFCTYSEVSVSNSVLEIFYELIFVAFEVPAFRDLYFLLAQLKCQLFARLSFGPGGPPWHTTSVDKIFTVIL